jgi:hypothetical protein
MSPSAFSNKPGRRLRIALCAAALFALVLAGLTGCEKEPTGSSRPADGRDGRREAAGPKDGDNSVDFVEKGVRHDATDPGVFQYIELNLQALDIGKSAVCKTRLAGIGKQIQMHVLQQGRLPKSLRDLDLSGEALRSPVREAGTFAYIGGQDPQRDRGNILVYDRVIYPGKACYALVVGSATPRRVRPEELDAAVGRTLKALGRR